MESVSTGESVCTFRCRIPLTEEMALNLNAALELVLERAQLANWHIGYRDGAPPEFAEAFPEARDVDPGVAETTMALYRAGIRGHESLVDEWDDADANPLDRNWMAVTAAQDSDPGDAPFVLEITPDDGVADIDVAAEVVSALQARFEMPAMGFTWNSSTRAGAVLCVRGEAPRHTEPHDEWLARNLRARRPHLAIAPDDAPAP